MLIIQILTIFSKQKDNVKILLNGICRIHLFSLGMQIKLKCILVEENYL